VFQLKGNSIASYSSTTKLYLDAPHAIAEVNPPISPGIPCKDYTPQVSWRPIFFLHQSFQYIDPKAATTPVIAPVSIANPGFTIKLHGAHMEIPPASVPFKSTSMSIFPFKTLLV